jgi:hypothetical protein
VASATIGSLPARLRVLAVTAEVAITKFSEGTLSCGKVGAS